MAPSCGDSHVLRRIVDEFIVWDGKRNQLTSSRSTCVLIRTDLPVPVVGSLLSYDQPSMGFFDGVLYTSPLPASSLAPIQAWPGWPPVKLPTEVVFEDTCNDW